jgi:hypothetical protein
MHRWADCVQKGRLLRGEKPIERGEASREPERPNIRAAELIRERLGRKIQLARSEGRDMTEDEMREALFGGIEERDGRNAIDYSGGGAEL